MVMIANRDRLSQMSRVEKKKKKKKIIRKRKRNDITSWAYFQFSFYFEAYYNPSLFQFIYTERTSTVKIVKIVSGKIG